MKELIGSITEADALEIRACRAEDLEALEWNGAHTAEREIIAQTFDRQERDEALMLVAAHRGFPVAQLWLDFGPGDTATVWALRTLPPLRGRGIGARLMRRAERAAARRGHRRLELTVDPGNPAALRFYARLGYAPMGEERVTYRCRSPEGEPWVWTVPHVKLARTLSASAGPSATYRTGASRR